MAPEGNCNLVLARNRENGPEEKKSETLPQSGILETVAKVSSDGPKIWLLTRNSVCTRNCDFALTQNLQFAFKSKLQICFQKQICNLLTTTNLQFAYKSNFANRF